MAKNIYWLGDSTVKYNLIDTYPQTGIGQAFEVFVKKEVVVHDLAENGRSTKSFINEGRFKPVQRYLAKDDFLFIQFGHNDSKPDEERHTEPYGEYTENLSMFVSTALERGAYPVLITPISRRLFDAQGNFLDGSHGEYPEAMRQVGENFHVPVIDMTKLTAKLISEAGDEKSKEWFMWIKPGESKLKLYEQGKEDNTHLKYVGAMVMAGMIREELNNFGGVYQEILVPYEII